jgi:hypothetical protein
MRIKIVPEFSDFSIGRLAKKLAFRQITANPHAGFLVFVANDWEKSEFILRNTRNNDFIIIDGFIEQVLAYESDSLNTPLYDSSIEWFYHFFEGLP